MFHETDIETARRELREYREETRRLAAAAADAADVRWQRCSRDAELLFNLRATIEQHLFRLADARLMEAGRK